MNPAADSRPGLSDLGRVPLSDAQEELLRERVAESTGPPHWRRRKEHEARQLLALETIAARLSVQALDLRTSLKALVELKCAVASLPPGEDGVPSGELIVGRCAVLALDYPEQILYQPIPGTQPVRILFPSWVHSANVSPGNTPVQALCLGTQLARGTPLREIVLGSYIALAMQAVTLAEDDPAGVMNHEAALWWQQRRDLIPLSRAPFLSDPADEPGVV